MGKGPPFDFWQKYFNKNWRDLPSTFPQNLDNINFSFFRFFPFLLRVYNKILLIEKTFKKAEKPEKREKEEKEEKEEKIKTENTLF